MVLIMEYAGRQVGNVFSARCVLSVLLEEIIPEIIGRRRLAILKIVSERLLNGVKRRKR